MGPGRFGNERGFRGGRWLRWGGLLLLVIATGLFAFQLGVEDERGRGARIAEEMARLTQANQRLEEANQRLTAENKLALTQLGELGDRLAAEATPGVPRELISSLKQQLDAGVDPQRLAGAIAALAPATSRPAADASLLPKAGSGEECEAPETKRVLVRTPIAGERPSMPVGGGGGAITVSAQGAATPQAQGRQAAWFEPKEPVTVKFAQTGGKTTEAAGKLPLQHAVTIGQTRYRFALTEGARGYVQVTSDRCKPR